jgi:peptide/nickel transport system substrate-binding protein
MVDPPRIRRVDPPDSGRVHRTAEKTTLWKWVKSARKWGVVLSLAASLLLAACQVTTPTIEKPTPAAATPSPTPLSTPKATSVPPTPTPAPRSLVICLVEEPVSLYIYGGGLTPATWNVLEAIYDGPVDRRGYSAQPVILQKLPSLADGDAQLKPVVVQAGDEIIDVNGDLMTLAKGVQLAPAGCSTSDCVVTWDGQSPLQMDQLSASFKFLPGLTWSDGAALKASDSVYSFTLASDPASPVNKFSVDRTSAYRALDDLTVEWVGKPGYLDASYTTNLWLPLPQHAWGTRTAAELLQAEDATTRPLGWGAYVIESWVKGDHITLRKNPAYFRAAQGLPKFDTLVYRFLTADPTAGLAALQSGECDVLDRSTRLDAQLPALQELQKNHKVQVVSTFGPEWEHLDFGIRPASYDNGYDTKAGDRPDFFGDVRTRQAFAYCLDRQGVVDQFLQGFSQVADSYLPPQHPLYNSNLTRYAFNPDEGKRLLDAVGWKEDAGNPAGPRLAQGIPGIPDGAPFEVNYWTTQAPLRQQVAEFLAQSLAQCGILAKTAYFSPSAMFAEGPDGPVFGRKFDLVQFAWESSVQPQCYLYQTRRIPGTANLWLDANITSYSNPTYDAACTAGLRSLPGTPGFTESQAKAQEIFGADLPVVPLYFQPKIAAARPDLCGFTRLDPSARSDLPGIEALDYGDGCS